MRKKRRGSNWDTPSEVQIVQFDPAKTCSTGMRETSGRDTAKSPRINCDQTKIKKTDQQKKKLQVCRYPVTVVSPKRDYR